MGQNIKKYQDILSEQYLEIPYIWKYRTPSKIFGSIGHWMGQIRIRSELPDADHGASNDWSSDEAMHFHVPRTQAVKSIHKIYHLSRDIPAEIRIKTILYTLQSQHFKLLQNTLCNQRNTTDEWDMFTHYDLGQNAFVAAIILSNIDCHWMSVFHWQFQTSETVSRWLWYSH